ncbi:phosphatidylinositol transfer protein csr1 [Coemansia sp. RSA 988]|nr:phosphatidylinositol transfer protein csr1 [Coemansia sp. RSA 988]
MTNNVLEQYDKGKLNLEGTLGHLTFKESALLQVFWRKLLEAFTNDASKLVDTPTAPIDTTAKSTSTKRSARSGKSHTSGKNSKENSANGSGWFGFGSSSKREEPLSYRQTVGDVAPTDSKPPLFSMQDSARTIRDAFWAATLCDHPDVLLLRFLRARKWNVDDALQMLLACLRWRLDEELDWIIWTGESSLNYSLIQRGIGYMHKTDRLGQPVLFIPVRAIDPSAQPQEQMVEYTIYLMEVARIMLHPPAEKVCLVFDTTNMSMSNMDWTYFKTFLHYLEHYYPECLGLVLIYNASWVFYSLWKLISPMLDPVVASKVHFASSTDDLQKFIAPQDLPREYGGKSTFEYNYVLPKPGENSAMQDETARVAAAADRRAACEKLEAATRKWAGVPSTVPGSPAPADGNALAEERNAAADALVASSRILDKHVRARTLYHRTGIIDQDLSIHW